MQGLLVMSLCFSFFLFKFLLNSNFLKHKNTQVYSLLSKRHQSKHGFNFIRKLLKNVCDYSALEFHAYCI